MTFYIDPGTGSMLFTILIGVLSAGVYAIKNVVIKLRFKLSGGSVTTTKDVIPLVIFSDDKRYCNVFEPICDELEKRGQDCVFMTASPDDPMLEKEYEHIKVEFIGEGNRAFAKLNMLKADIVLSTTPGLDVYQWKRSRDVKYYVHIFHGCYDATLYRMFGIDYYDGILAFSDFQIEQIRKLEALRNLPAKDIEVVGQPYMDTMKAKVAKAQGKKTDVPTVLLAPSWGDCAILSKYGTRIIDELVKTGYNIIVRPHPQSFKSETEMIEKLMKKYPDIEWNRDTDNFDVLSRSDILISDFSGVLFDFSLVFDRPVIYAEAAFIKDVYDAHWLDELTWTEKVLPLIGTALSDEKVSDIKTVIDDCLNNPDVIKTRQDLLTQTWTTIGKSAKLTVDFLMKKREELSS